MGGSTPCCLLFFCCFLLHLDHLDDDFIDDGDDGVEGDEGVAVDDRDEHELPPVVAMHVPVKRSDRLQL